MFANFKDAGMFAPSATVTSEITQYRGKGLETGFAKKKDSGNNP